MNIDYKEKEQVVLNAMKNSNIKKLLWITIVFLTLIIN